MKTTSMGEYRIAERRLDNGWYELSTMAYSMGEEYREHMRYDHPPTIRDYEKFLSRVESNK